MDIVQFAVGQVDEAWNAAAKVEQGVHLHRRLGGTEQGPGKHRQVQVDRGPVQRVDGVRQRQPQVLLGGELPRLSDQSLGELRVDAPVAGLVGVGQGRAPHRLPEAHRVELMRLRRQAGFDIAQAFPIGLLRKGQRPSPGSIRRTGKSAPGGCPSNGQRHGRMWSMAESP